MITELTKEQWAELPAKVDEWLALTTSPTDRGEQATWAKRMAAAMGCDPGLILHFSSPMVAELAGPLLLVGGPQLDSLLGSQLDSLLRWQLRSQLWSQLDSQLDSQLESQLDSQLGSQLNSQLDSQLDSQLKSQLRSQLESQLDSQLDSQLRSQLDSLLRSQLMSQLDSQLWSQLNSQLDSQLKSQLRSQLDSQLRSQLDSQLDSQLGSQLESQLDSQLKSQLWLQLGSRGLVNIWWGWWAALYELGKSYGVSFDEEAFELFVNYNRHIHHAKPYKDIWILSDKPVRCEWDGGVLSANGKQAVEYSDGWGWYSVNGVVVPEKYGSVRWSEWSPKWILEEENAELRRVIISKVGYEKMLHELEAKRLDSWREYELLRVELTDMPVPYQLLKMTCPSTGHTHILRVPPDMDKAESAASWINWGINPNEFSLEA